MWGSMLMRQGGGPMSGKSMSWLSRELQPLRVLLLTSTTLLIFAVALGILSFLLREFAWDMAPPTDLRGSALNGPSAGGFADEGAERGDAGGRTGLQPAVDWSAPQMEELRSALKAAMLLCGEQSRRLDPAFSEQVSVSLAIRVRKGRMSTGDVQIRPETSPHFRGCLQRDVPLMWVGDASDADWSISFELTRNDVEWSVP